MSNHESKKKKDENNEVIGEGTTSFIIKTKNPKYIQKVIKNDSKTYKELLKKEYDTYMHFNKHCKSLKKFLVEIKEYNSIQPSLTMTNLLEVGYINLYNTFNSDTKLTDTNKLVLCNSMVDFLTKLHNFNYTHSDIKPNNIFMNPKKLKIKFIDFGFSKPYKLEEFYNPLGTILFSNPEMIQGIIIKNKLNGKYFYLNDWWGLGMTFIFLLYNDEYNNYKKFMNVLISRFKENSSKINIRKNIEKYRKKFDNLLFQIFNIHFFE